MIISASRRTDIPSYYSDWFYNRIKEGFVYVRNPVNPRQISDVSLSPEVVDGMVFWTKNPLPMMDRLDELEAYSYYFQFTLNAYQSDVEAHLPSKSDVLIPVFKRLSEQIGPEHVIWRYDPILLNEKYTVSHHVERFGEFARQLKGYTRKCTISFLDYYRKIAKSIERLGVKTSTEQEKHILAKSLSTIAREHGLGIDTCAEDIDLGQYGIGHARCIDDQLLEEISGYRLKIGKDPSQRAACGCVSSIDIGMYNTCRNGCVYCYANHSRKIVENNAKMHDPSAPLLSETVGENDVVYERKVASNRDGQLSFLNDLGCES